MGNTYHVKSRELLLMVAEDTYSHCTHNLQCVRAAQAPGDSAGHKATFIKYQWLPKEPSSLAFKRLKGSVLTIVLFSGRKRFVLGEQVWRSIRHSPPSSAARLHHPPLWRPFSNLSSSFKKAVEALHIVSALAGGSGEGESQSYGCHQPLKFPYNPQQTCSTDFYCHCLYMHRWEKMGA